MLPLAGTPHFDARPVWLAPASMAIALSVFALMLKLTWM
jgi:hypothetical protein